MTIRAPSGLNVAALWVGALLVAAGELADPFPAAIEELAREYFGWWPPEAKA